ncbi:MAG TPA: helix-hairpin-helix domain-containing protein, partial [Gemmatimonadaceae bacterium]|nr:helix-hairpin-helix domain-containing protein [Gemmatimonadaceae bacterium]
APLPGDEAADVQLSEIRGMPAATVAILEEAGFRTLNDIIDLEKDDFIKLPGITLDDADRLMTIIDELTEEGGGESDGEASGGDEKPAA